MKIEAPGWIDGMSKTPAAPRRSVRVLLVEGNPLLRAGLRLLLENCRGLEVAGDRPDADGLPGRPDWDVLLLDFDLTGHDGLHLVRRARQAAAKRGLLVLSSRCERTFGARALQAGADGFVSKSAQPRELLQAIDRVAAGGRWVSPALAEQLALPTSARPLEALSAREFQILCGIASGRPGKELAHALGISPKTVCTYRARLLEKLGLKSDADLVHYALEAGLRRKS
jgi:DNA-binding NarL/FixJ family response regulator